jgi:transcriptional regulator with XRE-family HTH domain
MLNVPITDFARPDPGIMVSRMSLRIKEIRKALGISQQVLADRCGMSRNHLSEIESEKKPANTLRLTAIAAAMGVPVADLSSRTSRSLWLV